MGILPGAAGTKLLLEMQFRHFHRLQSGLEWLSELRLHTGRERLVNISYTVNLIRALRLSATRFRNETNRLQIRLNDVYRRDFSLSFWHFRWSMVECISLGQARFFDSDPLDPFAWDVSWILSRERMGHCLTNQQSLKKVQGVAPSPVQVTKMRRRGPGQISSCLGMTVSFMTANQTLFPMASLFGRPIYMDGTDLALLTAGCSDWWPHGIGHTMYL